MSEFFVGQKVVCVDDDFTAFAGRLQPDDQLPVRGTIYTVSKLLDGGLQLVEIRRSNLANREHAKEAGYYANRFRPLEETSKTLEQFREIARGVSNGKPIIEDASWRMPTPEKVKA